MDFSNVTSIIHMFSAREGSCLRLSQHHTQADTHARQGHFFCIAIVPRTPRTRKAESRSLCRSDVRLLLSALSQSRLSMLLLVPAKEAQGVVNPRLHVDASHAGDCMLCPSLSCNFWVPIAALQQGMWCLLWTPSPCLPGLCTHAACNSCQPAPRDGLLMDQASTWKAAPLSGCGSGCMYTV